jgi:hypothetical protein
LGANCRGPIINKQAKELGFQTFEMNERAIRAISATNQAACDKSETPIIRCAMLEAKYATTSWKPSTLEVGSQGEKTEAENKELLNRREEKKATSDDEQGI